MITVADLLAPEGPLEEDFFEGESVASISDPSKTKLEVRLERYIERGYEKVVSVGAAYQDDLAKLWALYLSFDAVYLKKCNAPVTENDQDISLGARSYSFNQIKEFRAQSERYLESFTQGMAELPSMTPYVTRTPQSRTTRNIFKY